LINHLNFFPHWEFVSHSKQFGDEILMWGVFCVLNFQHHQPSPRSTPNSSPRSTKSPPLPTAPLTGSLPSSASRSAPATPGGLSGALSGSVPEALAGDVRSAFGGGGAAGQRCLRSDLLVAADSVTCAMSTLVKELNSGEQPQQPPQPHAEAAAASD
jgi:predicted lipid-binding transport protein (Tim44 family)